MTEHTEPPHRAGKTKYIHLLSLLNIYKNLPVVLHTAPAQLKPVRRGKVDSLSQVVSMVEASVITSGEGNDELPGVLIHPVFLLVNNCSLVCVLIGQYL